MPKHVHIDADTPIPETPDYRAEYEEAQTGFDELMAERREKRATMSKVDFRAYNAETHDLQVAAQTALEEATHRLARAEGRTNTRVAVGTAKEAGKAGKVGKG